MGPDAAKSTEQRGRLLGPGGSSVRSFTFRVAVGGEKKVGE